MQCLAAIAMWLCGLADHRIKRGLPHQQVVLAGASHGAQDIAAAVRLFADEPGIGELLLIGQLVEQLRAHQLDRRERCAKLMRGRRDDAAEVGQLLFARQRHLGGNQCVGHGVDLVGHAPGIERHEADADDDRQPEAEAEDVGHLKDDILRRSQRKIEKPEQGDEENRRTGEQRRRLEAQGGCRNRDRRKDQKREGVVEAAGQIDQEAQLREIEEQREKRLVLR